MIFRLVHFVIYLHHLDSSPPKKALREHPNTKRVVGDSLGGSVALELQRHHPNFFNLELTEHL